LWGRRHCGRVVKQGKSRCVEGFCKRASAAVEGGHDESDVNEAMPRTNHVIGFGKINFGLKHFDLRQTRGTINCMKINFVAPSNLDLSKAHHVFRLAFATALAVGLSQPSLGAAATSSGSVPVSNTLVSGIDRDLTIHRTGVLPATDNVDGIYARPIESRLKELVREAHIWDGVDVKTVGQTMSTAELEKDPETIKKIAQAFDVDALLSARAVRNGNSVSLSLDMFLAKDGQLFLQEESHNSPRTETKEVLKDLDEMMKHVLAHLPYSGMVLSRSANRVTMNLGSKDGIREGQTLSAALLVNAERHPKFHFYINSEKEIIARIRIDKVEPTLAFGTVLSEKERGIVRKDTKILASNFVSYEGDPSTREGKSGVGDDPQRQLVFGDKPTEWVATAPPTFGRVNFKLGLGSASYSTSLQSAGSIQGQSSLFPQLSLLGEIWFNPRWIVRINVQEGIMSFSNPLSGSSPSTLNVSLSRYAIYGGYNILLKDDFFGPKIQLLLGLDQTNLFVDSSTPLGLTTTSYSGLAVGAAADFPVNFVQERDKYALGLSLFLHLNPGLKESPQSSGASSNNSITQFSFYGSSKLGERTRAIASLDFDFYSTTFSGPGSRTDSAYSSSQRITTLNGGVEWLF
jgi:hypothetical protein